MVNDKSFFAREYASLGKKPCTSLETGFRRKMAVASMPKDFANSDLKWGALRRNLREILCCVLPTFPDFNLSGSDSNEDELTN